MPIYIYDLVEWTLENTICEIHCVVCGEQELKYGNEDVAAKAFFNKGWRATKTSVYCPECAKKRLKNN